MQELELRAVELEESAVGSIYFGGGTPSLLNARQLAAIFQVLDSRYQVAPDAEITLEANPDDLSHEKLDILDNSPVNRLSIGIQSFFDQDLRLMHRAHSALEARQSIEQALKKGFVNLTIDLIYGSPNLSDAMWEKNLEIATSYAIPHLSCYQLTVEPKTVLAHQIKKGEVSSPAPETGRRHLELLMAYLGQKDYLHYEISNFCRPGAQAVHNTNYWRGIPYLGIGPSGHSFDGKSRSWNIANNARYMRSVVDGDLPRETEILSAADRYNEYIMTGLRCSWGVELLRIAGLGQHFLNHFRKHVETHLQKGLVTASGQGNYTLSHSGKFLADRISSDLFWVEE